MAKATVHCRVCKQEFNRLDPALVENIDWVQPVKKFYYHKKCYEDFANKKGKISEGDITLEAEDEVWRSAVYDYLKRDIKILVDYPKFISQWNNLLKDGKTAKGIYFTIRYFYEVEKGDPSKADGGIGIVSYTYEKGTTYWGERNQKDKGIVAAIEKQILEAANQNIVNVKLKKQKRAAKSAADALAAVDMEDE
jgi:hypothetical protein